LIKEGIELTPAFLRAFIALAGIFGFI